MSKMVAGPPAKSILVVEDDDAIRHLIREAIRAAGFTVSSVSLADEALGVLDSNQFDLIVLDLGMPRGTMQGMELLARIREIERWKHIPVVILSGYGDLVNRDVTARLGVAAILSKPLSDVEQLINVLRRTLSPATP
jgi:CheY-like chemotaxis protein